MYIIYRKSPNSSRLETCGDIFGIVENEHMANQALVILNNNQYGHVYSWVKLSVYQTLDFLGMLKDN